jgi:hypothetical protein
MKKLTKAVLFISALSALISCSPSYYQLYSTKASSMVQEEGNSFTYEDENCIVTYNFWADGGQVWFKFYNKSDSEIHLHLDKSYLVLNGVAMNYYQNRVFTYSTSSGTAISKTGGIQRSITGLNAFNNLQTDKTSISTTRTGIRTSGEAISFNEERVLIIPAKTAKIVQEHILNNSIYRDCNLLRYPRSKNGSSVSFSETNSPIVFKNLIQYSLEKSEALKMVENHFFISTISNFNESGMYEYIYPEFCGTKSAIRSKIDAQRSAKKFYNSYQKGIDRQKH